MQRTADGRRAVTDQSEVGWPLVLRVKRKLTDAQSSPSLLLLSKKGRFDKNADDDDDDVQTRSVGFLAEPIHSTSTSISAEIAKDVADTIKRSAAFSDFEQWRTNCKRVRVVDLEPNADDDKSLRVVHDQWVEIEAPYLKHTVDDAQDLSGSELLLKEFGVMDVVDEEEDENDNGVQVANCSASRITVNGQPLEVEKATKIGYDYYVYAPVANWDSANELVDGFGFELVNEGASLNFDSKMFPLDEDDQDSEDSNAENYYTNEYPDEDYEHDNDDEEDEEDDDYDYI